METTVDNFLSEINEMAPLNKITENSNETSLWKKCFDEKSGFHYYWNVKTNTVTWETPDGYCEPVSQGNSNIMPPTKPIGPTNKSLHSKVISLVTGHKNNNQQEFKYAKRKRRSRSVESDDERITLISSYGEDTSESEDDAQSTAPVMDKPSEIKTASQEKTFESDVSGIRLLAGYSSHSDSEDDAGKEPENDKSGRQGTLFPIIQPIDVHTFDKQVSTNGLSSQDLLEPPKCIQRKRRINVDSSAVMQSLNRMTHNAERKGLGYTEDERTQTNTHDTAEKHINNNSKYPGFKSAGTIFNAEKSINNEKGTGEMGVEVRQCSDTLREKLTFLSEGKHSQEVSAVQVMLIQMETLLTALRAGDLKEAYMSNWLKTTCDDLIKLENETTPAGWLLHWDRSHKRYYYQNEETGESQWEFPDEEKCQTEDDAMDICTTPPPSISTDETTETAENVNFSRLSKSSLSLLNAKTTSSKRTANVTSSTKRDEFETETLKSIIKDGQPLPPGVDLPPTASTLHIPSVDSKNLNSAKKTADELTNALDSFYSDIAAIESTPNAIADTVIDEPIKKEEKTSTMVKKKKNRIKLTQGVSLKKKDVSKLVQKWKNIKYN